MKRVCVMVLGSAVALVLTTGHGFAQAQPLDPMPWGPSDQPANALVAKPAETVTVVPSQSLTMPVTTAASDSKPPETMATMPSPPAAKKAAAKRVAAAATAEQPASPTAAPAQAAKKPAAKTATVAKKTKANQPAANTAAKKEPPPLPVQAEAAQDQPGPLRRLWNRVVSNVNTPTPSTDSSAGDIGDVFSTKDSQ